MASLRLQQVFLQVLEPFRPSNQFYLLIFRYFTEVDDSDSIKSTSAVLGDYLVFLRRIAVTSRIKTQLCCARWLDLFLLVISNRTADGVTLGLNLRCRLLCLYLLKVLLPYATQLPEKEHLPQVKFSRD